MSLRPLACSLLAAAVVLAGCGAETKPDVTLADPTESQTDAVIGAASPAPTHALTEGDVDGRSADALFGADVCRALLPALDGDAEGLESYAAEVVLAELSDGAGGAPISQEADVYEGELGCFIVIGDLTWTLELLGDGHVGQRAVQISTSLGLDSGGGAEADPAAIADAATVYRDSGEACGGEAEELSEGAPNHAVIATDSMTVVAITCATFAYQSIVELMLWDGELFGLVVQQWRDGITEDSMILGYPYADAGLLVNLEKARGPGDCGLYQVWTPGEGDVLLLAEARSRDCDDQSEYVEPTDWELVYGASS